MSAIAAIWHFDGKPSAGDDMGRMLAALTPHGPDRRNLWQSGDVALGQCLARVLPEDRFDRQPLVGKGDATVLVADLRLDNRNELHRALAIDATAARNMADSAVLLAAWERWGEGCLDRIIGDFAFAIWDAGERRLFCARDHFGLRPLYFHRGASFIAIASMPKGLFALADIPRTLDEAQLAYHLALLPQSGASSIYRDVMRVPPGHCLTVTADGHELRRYWTLDLTRRIELGSDAAYVEAFRAHLDEAVRCRLRAVGPLGSHLSGGLDSTTVAVTAARHLAGEDRRLFAFTSVPRDGSSIPPSRNRFADEGPHAAAVALHYSNIDHVLVRNTGRSPLEALAQAAYCHDRPILNACNLVWMDAIDVAARSRGVRTLLIGAMGNMSVSYDGLPLIPDLLRCGRYRQWLHEARALVRPPVWRRRGVAMLSLGPFLPNALWKFAQRFSASGGPSLAEHSALSAECTTRADVASRAREVGWDLDYRPWHDGRAMRAAVLGRFDVGDYFAGALASRGIDYRDPTIDKRLVEFCLAIPEEQFLRNGETKYLLRRAMTGALPAAVLNERRKGLQAADWYENMTAAREEIAEEIERLAASPTARSCLDIDRMRRLVADWPSGGWQSPSVVASYRLALLRGIATGRFIRYIEGSNA